MQTSFLLDNNISFEHIEFFRKNGYLHFKKFISKSQVDTFLAELKSISDHILTNNIKKVNGVLLKFGIDGNGDKVIRRLAFATKHSDVSSAFTGARGKNCD